MSYFIYQTNPSECGFACLKMLLAHLYKERRMLYLPHQSHPTRYTLFELKEIAKQYGVIINGYLHKCTDEVIKEKTPFIIIRHLENGDRHAVLVKKISKTFIVINDPEYGMRILLTKKFLKDINEGMEVLVVENFSRVEINFEVPKLLSCGKQALLIVFEALSIACYFVSAILLSPGWSDIIPIIVISVGVILAIVYRTLTYKFMKRFDEDFVVYTYDENPKIRSNNYRLMHETKSGLFSNGSSIVMNFVSAIAVNTILILNNNYSLYMFITAVLLVLINYVYIIPILKKNSHKVERLENDLLNAATLSRDDYLNSYQEIRDQSYKIVKGYDMVKIVSYFLLLIVTFIIAGLNGFTSIEFIIYNFAMAMFTYTSLDMGAKGIENYAKNIINKTKFYDLIINRVN